MMEALLGVKYAGFIASAFGSTFVVLALMVLWVVLTYKQRKDQLARMEKAGLKRAARTQDEQSA